MGITIHYHGRVNPKLKVKEFYIYAALICKEKKWAVTDLVETEGAQLLDHPEEAIPYNGKLSTFTIRPHEHCEPLLFQITQEGYFKNWCKSQFAPLEVHMGIVDMFDQVKIKLSELVIQDEGGYWESRNAEALEERIVKCFMEIQNSKEEDPDYYGPVKSEDGRITDLMKES
ncbi:MAG TPA: hypothetical protein VJ385_03765 [Fibrobacteria bacterium]|nr:hypothetical protein [Fibrobacteria bacterium]